MPSLRIAAFALVLLGSSMVVGQASAAMPVDGLTSATKQIGVVQDVRWCGPYRCWGRPYYWGRGPYWGRPYWRRCGWRRCWW
jgi:hypothetical protein